jgi:hypothetical protein
MKNRKFYPETIHDVPVVILRRDLYINRRADECPAYMGETDNSIGNDMVVVIWQNPNNHEQWFVELFINGMANRYWGTITAIALWLFKNGVYPIFGGITDTDVSLIINDYMKE